MMQNKIYPSTILQTILYILIGFVIASPFAAPFLLFEKQIAAVVPKDIPLILTYLIVMTTLILWAFVVNTRRKLHNDFNFKLVGMQFFPIMVLFIFSFQLGINLPIQKVFYSLFSVIKTDFNYSLVYILSALLFAPVFEEILFRGIILNGLLSSYSPPKSILISAIIFGLFHGQPTMIPGAIFFGLFFGYVYCKTNSLGITMILHFAANLFGIIASFMNFKFGNFKLVTVNDLYGSFSIFIILALLFSFVISVYYMKIKSKNVLV